MKLAILSITLIFPFVLVIEKGWSYESTEKVSKYKNHCNILDGNYKITDKLVKIEYQTVSKAPNWKLGTTWDFQEKSIDYDFKSYPKMEVDLCRLAYDTAGLVRISIDNGNISFIVKKGRTRYTDRYYNPRYPDDSCYFQPADFDKTFFLESNRCKPITLNLEGEHIKVFCHNGSKKMELNLNLLRFFKTKKFIYEYNRFDNCDRHWDGPEKSRQCHVDFANQLGFVNMPKDDRHFSLDRTLEKFLFTDPKIKSQHQTLKDFGCDTVEGAKKAQADYDSNRCERNLSLCHARVSSEAEAAKRSITIGGNLQKKINAGSDECFETYKRCTEKNGASSRSPTPMVDPDSQ